MKTFILTCRFCQKITGQYTYPDNLTVADLGIADVRCGDCEKKYGSYKEMHDIFLRDVGTHDEFLTTIKKADYKKADFDVEVSKIKQAKIKPVLGKAVKRKLKK